MKSFRLLPLAAVLGAAMSVQAADVEMFGFFDQGLAYVHEELNKGMASPTGQTTANPQGFRRHAEACGFGRYGLVKGPDGSFA